jgi:hypothetical protein
VNDRPITADPDLTVQGRWIISDVPKPGYTNPKSVSGRIVHTPTTYGAITLNDRPLCGRKMRTNTVYTNQPPNCPKCAKHAHENQRS